MIKGISAFFFVTLGILFLAATSFANNPLDRYFGESTQGKLLVASSAMNDNRFKRSVVLMVNHDADGAFGLIINKPLSSITKNELFDKLQLEHEADEGSITIFYGGPVGRKQGFVIHEAEYQIEGTRRVTNKIAVSPERDVILAMAKDEGPKRYLFALGYSGWLSGQLEFEMRREFWLTAPADMDIIFDESHRTKWQRANDLQFRSL